MTFMEQLYVSFYLGYGSFDYEEAGYEETLVVKVDILLNDEPVPELSTITHSSKVRRFYKSDTCFHKKIQKKTRNFLCFFSYYFCT